MKFKNISLLFLSLSLMCGCASFTVNDDGLIEELMVSREITSVCKSQDALFDLSKRWIMLNVSSEKHPIKYENKKNGEIFGDVKFSPAKINKFVMFDGSQIGAKLVIEVSDNYCRIQLSEGGIYMGQKPLSHSLNSEVKEIRKELTRRIDLFEEFLLSESDC